MRVTERHSGSPNSLRPLVPSESRAFVPDIDIGMDYLAPRFRRYGQQDLKALNGFFYLAPSAIILVLIPLKLPLFYEPNTTKWISFESVPAVVGVQSCRQIVGRVTDGIARSAIADFEIVPWASDGRVGPPDEHRADVDLSLGRDRKQDQAGRRIRHHVGREASLR